MTPTSSTRNEIQGFHGAIDPAFRSRTWDAAIAAVSAATGFDADAARDFLDSRHGRHFAKDVVSGQARGLETSAAVDAAVTRWMGWRIGRRSAREHGIPEELPYLTGFIGSASIDADDRDAA
ncbi:MAG: hypothetical protein IPK81_14005 [Rhodospirillales bacterium]|nr:MAG: hypothetical protein IPK81_14005 [Rhodospirillales bacterium]